MPFTTGRESAAGAEIESLEMPGGTWAISDGGRFWLHRPAFLQDAAFSRHLLEPGNAAHTRQLLAAALAAGVASRPRERDASDRRTPSLLEYTYGLAGSYHTTHATPPTMRRVADLLRARGDAALARHCSDVADEESGHDALALKDLDALGLRSAEFVRDVQPRNAMALVALFTGLARGPRPPSVLGYAYALERLALLQTQESIDAIEALVPPGMMATRCLRVHSAVGSDAGHVTESLEVIARLPPSDRIAIVHAAFETAALMTSPTDYPGDAAAGELVSRYRR